MAQKTEIKKYKYGTIVFTKKGIPRIRRPKKVELTEEEVKKLDKTPEGKVVQEIVDGAENVGQKKILSILAKGFLGI